MTFHLSISIQLLCYYFKALLKKNEAMQVHDNFLFL